MELSRSSDDKTGSVTLVWAPPTERVNGTPLQDDEISRYAIRYRASSSEPFTYLAVNHCNSNQCSYKIEDLPNPRNLTFEVAAVDTVGLHSAFVTASN